MIKNLYVDRPKTSDVGLFGCAGSNAVIENVGTENVYVRGGDYEVSGLVGYNDGGSVSDSYSACTVVGNAYVGGFVGYNEESSVSNSYSTGSVTGGEITGGLIGKNTGTVSNSFWDIETSGMSSSAGGTGKTTMEMKTKSTFTDAGWNFQDVWRMGSAPSGRWTSSWIDLSDTVNYSSLRTTTSIPGNAGASVRVQVSNDKSKVLCETNFVKLKDGFNKINLKSLPAARYARVVYKLVRGSTPVLEDYRLNYTVLP